MSTTTETSVINNTDELEFVTFYVNDLLMGVDIQFVREINRQLDLTEVPHTDEFIRGVVNLRGEVVTVVDLRTILGAASSELSEQNSNVIVNSKDEHIGLLVDRIADVVIANPAEIEPPPANVSGIDGRFFKGVLKLDTELLVILDIEQTLTANSNEQ